MEREKIQLLAQLNKAMLDGCTQLENALVKRDTNLVSQLKTYLLETQKKFDISLKE